MPSSPNRVLREQGFEPFHITWFLAYSERIIQHNCSFCKKGLFRTQRRLVTIMPDSSPIGIPYSIQCSGCGNVFDLISFNG